MNTVHQFPLNFSGELIALDLPANASALRFDVQGNTPQLWALVNDEAEPAPRYFAIIGTGQAVPAEAHYIGTANFQEFVWHLFETAAPPAPVAPVVSESAVA